MDHEVGSPLLGVERTSLLDQGFVVSHPNLKKRGQQSPFPGARSRIHLRSRIDLYQAYRH